ncbi:MAG: hypothetical protein ACKOUM_07640 [Sphingopyxis sp.]
MTGVALASAVALPVMGQESLLPPGFDQPTPKGANPAPTPTSPPRPGAGGAGQGASGSTSGGASANGAPGNGAGNGAGNGGAGGNGGANAPAPGPRASGGSGSGGGGFAAAPRPGFSTVAGRGAVPLVLGPDGLPLPVQPGAAALPPPPPRYDLPPGSRRMLSRVGPLTAQTGGLAPTAFGNRGLYLTALMEGVRGPIVSRWGGIALRRALLTGADTPPTVNGADFTAARATLLLRQGDVNGARMLVQSVDIDKASARLRAAALQVYLASADPAGLCPYVPAMAGRDNSWKLVQGMCASMVGEPGTANALVERVRRSGRMSPIDVKLAEKIVGAGMNSRRAATVRWDDVESLTPWRMGLASAVGVAIPAELWRTATVPMRRWAVQVPMIDIEQRLAFANLAAEGGQLSARAYVDLVSYAAAGEAPSDAVADRGAALRAAFMLADRDARIAAITALSQGSAGYGGRVLGARAAARLAPMDLDDAQSYQLMATMLAGGLDRNAMAWAGKIPVGSQAWGLLAVASPRQLVGVNAGQVDDFAGDDESADQIRTRFLAAALIGLDRVPREDANDMASEYSLALGTQTRWTRAITMAAARNEPGTVALLAAVGLQGAGWRGVPPYHLFHIMRAMRQVGLGAEARMIAAEALTRA